MWDEIFCTHSIGQSKNFQWGSILHYKWAMCLDKGVMFQYFIIFHYVI